MCNGSIIVSVENLLRFFFVLISIARVNDLTGVNASYAMSSGILIPDIGALIATSYLIPYFSDLAIISSR